MFFEAPSFNACLFLDIEFMSVDGFYLSVIVILIQFYYLMSLTYTIFITQSYVLVLDVSFYKIVNQLMVAFFAFIINEFRLQVIDLPYF